MTMHLVRGMSTIRTSKPKEKKLTRIQQETLVQDHKDFNKRMRQIHAHELQMTFNEYVDYTRGIYKPKTTKSTNSEAYKPAESVCRETPRIPSLSNGMRGIAAKKEPLKYTGTLIKGIATMHKSNAVPVINDVQAKEISEMSR